MASLLNVLSKIINGQENFCCLCFKILGQEFVVVDENNLEMLRFILDTEMVSTLPNESLFCKQCSYSIEISFKFTVMCKENLLNLHRAIQNITESVDSTNVSPEFNTLYISIDKDNFNCNMYFDEVRVTDCFTAYKRLKSYKKSSRSKPRTYIHRKVNTSEILFDIPTVPTSNIILKTKNCNPKILKCKECHKSFRGCRILRNHYFKKHYPRDVKCSKCSKCFISIDMLKQHNLQYHTDLVCSQCGKNFTNKYILRKHENSHGHCIITCEECGRKYQSRAAFVKHINDNVCSQRKRKSSSQGTYFCDHCDKKFCSKPYLAKHIKYEHNNAEGFKCNFCDKQFYTPSGLESHIVKHTLEKKFVCDECGNRFVSKMSLIYHTRLHTGEKPYKCEHCEKSFLSASRRIDHTRRHHMQPSLECDICQSKFKATGSLLKHRKRHFNPNSRLNSSRFLIKELNCNTQDNAFSS